MAVYGELYLMKFQDQERKAMQMVYAVGLVFMLLLLIGVPVMSMMFKL